MILNKKELTLGHTYHYEKGGVNIVKQLTYANIFTFRKFPELFSGVPLTAKVLTENLGFEKYTNEDTYEIHDCVVSIENKKIWISQGMNDVESIIVENVHELQNLYYDLTGEDLEFKTVKG